MASKNASRHPLFYFSLTPMSMAFSHSLRSLQSDRNYVSLLILGLISLLFCGWLAWFLLASLPQYEQGEILQTSSDGVVLAQFPPTAQTRLQPGQSVQLYLAGTEQTSALPGTVAELQQPAQGKPLQVTIYADLDAPGAAALREGLSGRVLVKVEQLSPAAVLLRMTGQDTATPSVFPNP